VAESYKKWLRGRPCAADGVYCGGKVIAAHVDHAGGKGMGLKVADRYCIPLCDAHHTRQHNKGWHTFEGECLGGKSAVAMADAYWNAWPGRIEWERENERS
jgi:hypothetical protein